MLVLGYKAATEQFQPNELLDYVVEAENAGFDSVDASDHFHPWRNDGVHCSFVWTWLGAVAARTKKIHLGTGVTCPTIRYNPAVVAEMAATMGVMFPGRFWLGLGSGEALSEAATTAYWPDYPERRGRLIEAIEIIQRLFDAEYLTYRGRYFETKDAHLYDLPRPRVPIFVAASGKDSAEIAGKFGDGWITTGGASGPERDQKKVIPALEASAQKAGRDPAKLMRAVEIAVVYAKNPQEGLEQARLWASGEFPDADKYGYYDPRDMQKFGTYVSDKALESHWFISGDPNAHVELAEKFIEAGFTHLFFHSPGHQQREFIQFYGQQVLPRLRQKYGQQQRPAA